LEEEGKAGKGEKKGGGKGRREGEREGGREEGYASKPDLTPPGEKASAETREGGREGGREEGGREGGSRPPTSKHWAKRLSIWVPIKEGVASLVAMWKATACSKDLWLRMEQYM
jgi:hypothetical protein